MKENFPLTEEYYNRAYTIQPHSLSLQFHKGILNLKQKKGEAAAKHFIKLLDNQPEHEKAWMGLALSRKILGDEELAEACLLRCLDIKPNNAAAIKLKEKWTKPFLKPISISFHFAP